MIPPADPFIPYCRSLSLFSSFFLSTNTPISRFPFPISPIPHSNQPFHSSFSTLSLSLTHSLTFSSSRSCRVYLPFLPSPRRGLFFLFSGWSSSICLFDLLFLNPPSHPHHLHPPLLSLPPVPLPGLFFRLVTKEKNIDKKTKKKKQKRRCCRLLSNQPSGYLLFSRWVPTKTRFLLPLFPPASNPPPTTFPRMPLVLAAPLVPRE